DLGLGNESWRNDASPFKSQLLDFARRHIEQEKLRAAFGCPYKSQQLAIGGDGGAIFWKVGHGQRGDFARLQVQPVDVLLLLDLLLAPNHDAPASGAHYILMDSSEMPVGHIAAGFAVLSIFPQRMPPALFVDPDQQHAGLVRRNTWLNRRSLIVCKVFALASRNRYRCDMQYAESGVGQRRLIRRIEQPLAVWRENGLLVGKAV